MKTRMCSVCNRILESNLINFNRSKLNICRRCLNDREATRRRKLYNRNVMCALLLKGQECSNCGEIITWQRTMRTPRAYAFHHIDPKSKEYSMSDLFRRSTWSSIEKELDKCELLCDSCHAKYHWSIRSEQRRRQEERKTKETKEWSGHINRYNEGV